VNNAVRERLGLSFLAALSIHILAFALLSLIPWDQGADLSRMKPVVVFASLPEQLEDPEPLPEPEPELAQVPEEAPVQEAPPEPKAPAPAPRQDPAPSEAPPAPRPTPAAPRPSREPRIAQPVQPQAPPAPRQAPADQWSEGPQIVYGDDPADPEEKEQQLSRAPEDGPRPSLLEEEEGLEDQIAAIGSTPSTGTGTAGSPSVRTGEQSDPADRPEVTFQGGAQRTLIDWRGDDIDPELLVGLPSRIEVEASFQLPADGKPQGLQIVTSSGSTELDNVIQQAVRSSQFSRLESGDRRIDRGLIRLVLQVQ
jgi:outer membrane biosynthesis protein TonB